MSAASRANDEQQKLWNSTAGQAWVDAQQVLDEMLKPFEDLLVEPVPAGSDAAVLDVGCGTGSTTIAIARKVGEQGRTVGIDISGPMIAAARARAIRKGVPATFVRADAQTYAFEPASFDLITSRFGVMFFDDFVGAFANLRRAAKDGAQLRFVAWRSAEENPFMTTAERAAAPLLPSVPPREPNAPGQFAFGDRDRVQSILAESGWADIAIEPIDVDCALPEKELRRYITQLGPLGRILQDVDEETRSTVIDTVHAAFDPFVHAGEVRFSAACWKVSARSPVQVAQE